MLCCIVIGYFEFSISFVIVYSWIFDLVVVVVVLGGCEGGKGGEW